MNWDVVKLGNICDLLSGNAWSASEFCDTGKVPIIRIQNMGNNENESFVYWNGAFDNKYIVKKGDMLLSLSGSIKVYIWDKLDALLNQRIVKLIPKSHIDSRWFYWQIHNVLDSINRMGKWALVNNVSITDLKEFPIPLPPLPTQKRIAAILDKADALRRKDQALLRKYDELAQAIFIDMFGDPVKNEKGWVVKKLGDCVNKIQIGPFGTQLHESDYISNGIPLINPMHINNLKVQPNYKYSISKDKYNELTQYHLQEGDVILARRGEMGRCALITETEKGFLCGTGSLFINVDRKVLVPLFLIYLLSRKSSRLALEKSSAGTTMPNLNKNIVHDFKIIVPDIKKQMEFVKAIKISEMNLNIINKSIAHSANLFQSLLQQAFRGELK